MSDRKDGWLEPVILFFSSIFHSITYTISVVKFHGQWYNFLYFCLSERIQLLFVKSGTGRLFGRYHERI